MDWFLYSLVEKLKILSVLIHQLLTYVISRDAIDDNCERLKQVQKQIRLHQWAEQRRDKDETHFRYFYFGGAVLLVLLIIS